MAPKRAQRRPKKPPIRPSSPPSSLPRGRQDAKTAPLPSENLDLWHMRPFGLHSVQACPRGPQNRSNSAHDVPKRAPRAPGRPKRRPRRPTRAPRWHQEGPQRGTPNSKFELPAPRCPQEDPKRPQEAPKRAPRGPKTTPQETSNCFQEAPERPIKTLACGFSLWGARRDSRSAGSIRRAPCGPWPCWTPESLTKNSNTQP